MSGFGGGGDETTTPGTGPFSAAGREARRKKAEADAAERAANPAKGGHTRRPGSPVDPVTGKPVDADGKPLDTAVPRGTGGLPAPVPIGANEALSASTAGAQSAAERQRKRSAAGLTLLHGGLRSGPRASLKQASLIGSN